MAETPVSDDELYDRYRTDGDNSAYDELIIRYKDKQTGTPIFLSERIKTNRQGR